MLARSVALVGALIVSAGSAHAADGNWTEIARSSKLGVGFEVLADSNGKWCAASPKVRMVLDSPDKLEDPAVRGMWTKAMTFLKTKQCPDMVSVTGAEVIAGTTVLATVASSASGSWAFTPNGVVAGTQMAEAKPAPSEKSVPEPKAAAQAPAAPQATPPAPSAPETTAGAEYAAFSSKTWEHVQDVGLAEALTGFDVSSTVAEGPFYGDWHGTLSCGDQKTDFFNAPSDIVMSVYNSADPQAIQIEQWYVRNNSNNKFIRTEAVAYIDGESMVTTRESSDPITGNMVYRAQASGGAPVLVAPYKDGRNDCQIRFVRTSEQPKTYIALQQRMAMAQQITAELDANPWRGSDFGKVKGGELTASCESLTAWLKKYPADHRTPLGGRSVLRHFSDADLVSATGWTSYDWITSKYGDRTIAFEKWVNGKNCRKTMSKGDYNLLRQVGYDKDSWWALRSRMKVDKALTGVLSKVLQYPYMPTGIADRAKNDSDQPNQVFRGEAFGENDVAQLKLLMTQVRTVMLTDTAINIAASVNETSGLEKLLAAEKKLGNLNIGDAAKNSSRDKVRQYKKVAGMGLLTVELDKLAALEPKMDNLEQASSIRDTANKVVADYLKESDADLVSVAYAEFFSGLEKAIFTAVESNLSVWDGTPIEPGQASARVGTVQTWMDTLTQLADAGGDKATVATLGARLDAAMKVASVQVANDEVAAITEHYTAAATALKAGDFKSTMSELDFVDGKLAEMNEVGALDAIDTLKAARQAFWTANLDGVADLLLKALSDAHAEGDEKLVSRILPVVQDITDRLVANADPAVSARFAEKVDAVESGIGSAAIENVVAELDVSLDSPLGIIIVDRVITASGTSKGSAWSEAAMSRQWKAKRLGYMEAALSKTKISDLVTEYLASFPKMALRINGTAMLYLDRNRFSQLSTAALLRQGLLKDLDRWQSDYVMADDTASTQRLDAVHKKIVADVDTFLLAVLDDGESDIEDMSDEDLAKWNAQFAVLLMAEREKIKASFVGDNEGLKKLYESLEKRLANDEQLTAKMKNVAAQAMRLNAKGGLVPDDTDWKELTSVQKKIRKLALEWTKAEAERVRDWRCKKTGEFDDADDDLLEAPLLGAEGFTVQSLACEMENGNLTVSAIVELSDNTVEIQTESDKGEFWKFRFRVTEVTKGKSVALVYEYASPFDTYGVKKDEWEVLRGMLAFGEFEPEMIEQMVKMRVDTLAVGTNEENEVTQSVQDLWDGIVASKNIILR